MLLSGEYACINSFQRKGRLLIRDLPNLTWSLFSILENRESDGCQDRKQFGFG